MNLTPKSMAVAGVMSGTSADGVDVALARITPTPNSVPRLRLLGHRGFPYPRALRAALLRVMEGEPVPAAEISRLNWRLGALYAGCVQKTCTALNINIALVGMHGQTVYHQAAATRYLGQPVRATWQLGEAAVLRQQLSVPVVSDLRAADLAAGGQGAPLVPMLDFCLYRSPRVNRILLNLGGIANFTLLPRAATPESVLAFDTGPANMVSDALVQRSFGQPYDRAGHTAAKGAVLQEVISQVMRNPYFHRPPPKSCGREQFGAEFAARFAQLCRHAGGNAADAVTTAAEFTAASIADAFTRFCQPRLPPAPTELIAAGGGTRNAFLMRSLTQRFAALGIKVMTTDTLGMASQAKEAAAFALLAWLTWHNLPGNLPSATGATHPVVLGKVSP